MIKKLFALFQDRVALVDLATRWEDVACEWRVQFHDAMGLLRRSQATNAEYMVMVDGQRALIDSHLRTIENLRGFCDDHRKTIARLERELESRTNKE